MSSEIVKKAQAGNLPKDPAQRGPILRFSISANDTLPRGALDKSCASGRFE